MQPLTAFRVIFRIQNGPTTYFLLSLMPNSAHHITAGQEKQLISLLQQGSKQAFEQLYDRYAPLLFGIILRINGGNHKEAEHTLRQTFIYIWQNKAAYDTEKERIFVWMIQCAQQVTCSLQHPTAPGSINGTAANHALPFSVHNSELRQRSGEGDDPVFQDKVLEMVYLFGKSVEESGRLMHVTPDMIRTGLKNAINRLKVLA